MFEQIVYLMRGLPCCGKSHTARKLAGDQGVVLETDEYFYHCVGDGFPGQIAAHMNTGMFGLSPIVSVNILETNIFQ